MWEDEDLAEARPKQVHFKCGTCGAIFPASVLPPRLDAAEKAGAT